MAISSSYDLERYAIGGHAGGRFSEGGEGGVGANGTSGIYDSGGVLYP